MFNMLNESCLCFLERGCEAYHLCFRVNSFSLTSSILVALDLSYSHYKLLKSTLIVFAKHCWVLTEFAKNSRRLRPCIPCLPCTLFPFTMECRYDITASKRVKKIEGLLTFLCQLKDLYLVWESSCLSLTKCDPQFFYTKVLQNWQNTDRNDKNICVAGFNHYSFATVCCSVF